MKTALLYGGAILLIAVMIFTLTTTLLDTGRELDENCRTRNDQLAIVNAKFEQLGIVFDLSIATRPAEAPPIDPQVLTLYHEFRQPIPLVPCSELE